MNNIFLDFRELFFGFFELLFRFLKLLLHFCVVVPLVFPQQLDLGLSIDKVFEQILRVESTLKHFYVPVYNIEFVTELVVLSVQQLIFSLKSWLSMLHLKSYKSIKPELYSALTIWSSVSFSLSFAS